MNNKKLTELLELKIEDIGEFDIINNIINGIEDKEELVELYNETKIELKNNFEIFINKQESFIGGIKDFFGDSEKEKLKRYYSILVNSSEKMYDETLEEMNTCLDEFFSYRTSIAQMTINKFLFYLAELKNSKIDKKNKYEKILTLLDNSENQYEAIYKKINNIEDYQKMLNFTGFEKAEQKLLSDNSENFVGEAIQGYNIGSMACGLFSGDITAAIPLAMDTNNYFKSVDKESRVKLIEYINTAFEYTQLVENVTKVFQNIIDNTNNLTVKIDEVIKKILTLFELFEPIVADFDNNDKYCVQIFKELTEQIENIYELLISEI